MGTKLTGLDRAAVAALRRDFTGTLVLPGDDGYDGARRVVNGMIDSRPALIARCGTATDVVRAVAAARDLGLEIAVRGGGHSVSGQSTVDDGMIIDLSPIREVTVDVDGRRVRVGGGALLRDMDAATTPHGLASVAGMVSHTGVGGLTLGGGYGWLSRMHGLACDNIVRAEVVTADGSIVVASDHENADLFWGIRGGGGNFGIVTQFEFRLHPIPPAIRTGDIFFDFDDGPTVLRAFFEYAADVPDEIFPSAFTVTGRAQHGLPESYLDRPVIGVSWAYVGDADDGERVAEPLRNAARPIKEELATIAYFDLQRVGDEAWHPGVRAYWKSSFTSALPEAGIEAFLSRGVGRADSGRVPRNGAEILRLGGTIARVGEDETAYSHRDAEYDFLAVGRWEDPADDEIFVSDARRSWAAVAPFASMGVYINNLGDEGQDRVKEAYGPKKYGRLADLKRRYDPENIFHRNQNIRPAEV